MIHAQQYERLSLYKYIKPFRLLQRTTQNCQIGPQSPQTAHHSQVIVTACKPFNSLLSGLCFTGFALQFNKVTTGIERMYFGTRITSQPSNRHSFNAGNLKLLTEAKSREEREGRSKSSFYRNRSLKQFFGDIPAIKEFQRLPNSAHNQNPKKIVNNNPPKISDRMHAKQSYKEADADEYLIKHRDKLKTAKRKDNEHITAGGKDGSNKRKNIVMGEKLGDTTAHTQRAQTDTDFYNPNAYKWRKTPSKQKNPQFQDNKSTALPERLKTMHNQPQIAKSQYYGTPNTSEKDKKIHQRINEEKAGRQMMRSSSTSSLGKKLKHHLGPKVVKDIFQLKSPRQKHRSLSLKKSLLFTFGI